MAAFVRALLDEGERVLLFAHHHAVMDAYKKELMRRTRHITRKNLPADGVLHLRNPAWPGFFVRGF